MGRRAQDRLGSIDDVEVCEVTIDSERPLISHIGSQERVVVCADEVGFVVDGHVDK